MNLLNFEEEDLFLQPPTAEKEHMFDKVVTPSDVGKLNRLVIPKQHAERFFPIDAEAKDKGLHLSFEDTTGKPWRFRYSYWNSSQSYVMTKGWSRFVKEKRLDAGDTVSFCRGVGPASRHKFFIDWKRRAGGYYHYRRPLSFFVLQSSIIAAHDRRRHSGYGFNPYLLNLKSEMQGQFKASAEKKVKKTVRLFGVDLDCEGSMGDDRSSSPASLQLKL